MRWQSSKGNIELNSTKNAEVDSNEISKRLNSALKLYETGDLQEAQVIYLSILQQKPHHSDALNSLGIIAYQTGEYDKAIKLIERAISSSPNTPAYYSNCGNVYRAIEKYDSAVTYYEQALKLKPDLAEAHYNLGNCYDCMRQLEKAIFHFNHATLLNPNFINAHNNLGKALIEKNEIDIALIHLKQALNLDHAHSNTHNNLGLAYYAQNNYEEAVNYYKNALRINPDSIQAHNNLGVAFMDHGHLGEALNHFKRAIKIKPDFAAAHFSLSLLYLLTGNLEEGWKEYKWRYDIPKNIHKKRYLSKPEWNGSSLVGKKIFVYAEQGLGDTIQFIRYIPLVAKYGGEIIVECDPSLIQVFIELNKYANIIKNGEVIPDFDVHAPLMSLPGILKTNIESIPASNGYISLDDALVKSWEKKLHSSKRFRVGLCWQGSKVNTYDRFRSVSLKLFSDLLSIDNIDFFSLQKGSEQEQINQYGFSDLITDYSNDIITFSDTAALIENMDLIISVDTAIVHLAGAMNKPTWVLTRYNPDWRWLLKREDTPWYPSIRLFRQNKFGLWQDVFTKIYKELKILA